jgi:hypothetical protein
LELGFAPPESPRLLFSFGKLAWIVSAHHSKNKTESMDPLNLFDRLHDMLDEVGDDDLPHQRSPRAVSPYLASQPRPNNDDYPNAYRGLMRNGMSWKQMLEQLQYFVMELSRSIEAWVAEHQTQLSGRHHRADVATGAEPPRKRSRTEWPDHPRHYYSHHHRDYGCQPRFPKLSKDDKDFYRHVHYVLDDIEQRVPPSVLMAAAIDDRSQALPEDELGEEEVIDEKDLSRHSAQSACMSENDPPNPRMRRHMMDSAVSTSLASDSSMGSHCHYSTSMAAFGQAFASKVAPALAECLMTLLIHLPADVLEEQDGPFATRCSSIDHGYMKAKEAAGDALRLSVSLLRRVGELWLRIYHHHHREQLRASSSSAPSESGTTLISPTQWCLLAERIGAGLAPDTSSSPHVTSSTEATMLCLATWLRVVLSTWKEVVMPQVTLSMQGVTAQHSPDGPDIGSVQWWTWLLGRVLPAAQTSYTDANWTGALQRLVDSAHEDRATPERAPPVGPYSQFFREATEVAVAFQALTARALEVVAKLAPTAGSVDLSAIDHPSLDRLVETYAMQSVSHALQIRDEASTFLLQVEEERRVEAARVAALRKEKKYSSFCNRTRDNGRYVGMDVEYAFYHASEDQEPPNWPSNYLTVVAFVVDRLDVAFRTSQSAAAIVQALRGQALVENGTTFQEQPVRESYLPLWKAATFLAVGTPLSDAHGRLVTDLTREALSSMSPAELAPDLAAIESLNLTVLRACQDNPRWLFESRILSIDKAEDDGFAASSSVEAALESLSSASAEVRHALLLAALQLSDVDRARPQTGSGGISRKSPRRSATPHSRCVQKRLWGLVLRGRDGKHEEEADVWTDYCYHQAQQRGLLEGLQL